MLRRRTVGILCVLWGCGTSGAPDPFVVDAGGDGDALPGFLEASAGPRPDASFGGPCLDDGQCNDGIGCTFDSCNTEVHRCQFLADPARCQNGTFCDGEEICDPVLGCRQGPVKDCNDGRTCTIDSCVEATQGCEHTLRDADGDGVPDGHCMPAGDCDDADPTVYPGHVEVCGNHKDDDCDGAIDESDCQKPSHDTCLDPLVIDRSGNYQLDTTAASFDYPGTCAPMDLATRRDVVAALVLTGDPGDVDLVAEAPLGAIALGVGTDCGKLATEIGCASGAKGPRSDRIARLRLRSLGPATYPVYVWTDRDEPVVLHVTFGAATVAPANETCALAQALTSGKAVTVSLPGTTRDLASRCQFDSGDLVYSILLEDSSDITVRATSLDGYGTPVVSLRRASCSALADEITCNAGEQAKALARALPKGTYYIAVSASAPTDIKLEVNVSPPTAAPVDETCAGAPLLAPNRTIDVSLLDHTDDVDAKCGPRGSIDAAYVLALAVRSDVLLVERIADGDLGTVSLLTESCDPASTLVCASDGTSPVRATLRGVAAGQYRVLAESGLGADVQLTAFVRAAVPPTLVPFADSCASPATIAESGGFYQGNTANAAPDFPAGCDVTGGGALGAPDQMLALRLSTKKRVIFDMQGTAYASILDVRAGDTCPGIEVPKGCSAGYGAARSYLDLTLSPGKYWVQVDGYGGQSGPWFLDVRVVEP